ncbi:MAG TPA: polysaccharide pyruvyl transferase family protein [Opitutaceae bacterium]|jgi:polysaccharide pyruvyl transferase WcaK-like protein|nr:polysaccharide pyruvyl transferase family protein [Opitutaceae bacterium]
MMLAGFLEVWPRNRPLFCRVSSAQRAVLIHRFPSVKWIVAGEAEPLYDLWLGVGDTPIQVLSGLFFLEHLEAEFKKAKELGARIVLAGIGAEREAVREKIRFSAVLGQVDLISTRDHETRDLLSNEFSVDPAKLIIGDDLAHIYLQGAASGCPEVNDRPLEVAVNYYAERMPRKDSLTVLRWLKAQQIVPRSAAFLSNEARVMPSMESRHYAELAWATCLDRRGDAVAIITPNRWATDLDDTVRHFATVQTVLSSRFHCLLSAAWFGCRVYGLGRSSKVETLCVGLGISHVKERGIKAAVLERGAALARPVPAELLDSKAGNARAAVTQILARLAPDELETAGGAPDTRKGMKA